MKVQHSLIGELTVYEFKLEQNTWEATINICSAKDEDVVVHRNPMVQEILFELQELRRSGKVNTHASISILCVHVFPAF